VVGWGRSFLLAALAVVTALSLPARASAQATSEETIAYFRLNCTSCHTIGGGRLAGPDLKDVSKRRERDWLLRYVPDPKAMIDSGDAYAQNLLKEARGVVMPTMPALTRDRAGKLIDLIDAESKLEKSQFAGMQVSDRPLTADDVALGAQLFRGTRKFASGAPPCMTCHSTRELGGLGGGLLGPDLSAAFSRLEGRKALVAWLSAPPSPTMQPVFRTRPLASDEILAVVAYLQSVAEGGAGDAQSPTLAFALSGCLGAGLLLALFDLVWSRRFRDVRRSLVEQSQP
jgi:mono/diheme cytochrome c family protein